MDLFTRFWPPEPNLVDPGPRSGVVRVGEGGGQGSAGLRQYKLSSGPDGPTPVLQGRIWEDPGPRLNCLSTGTGCPILATRTQFGGSRAPLRGGECGRGGAGGSHSSAGLRQYKLSSGPDGPIPVLQGRIWEGPRPRPDWQQIMLPAGISAGSQSGKHRNVLSGRLSDSRRAD